MPFETTAPGHPATRDALKNHVPVLGLVILWSDSEPHRVGEIAFFPPFETVSLGRGGVEGTKFPPFIRHRPGVPLLPDPTVGFLGGPSLSRQQATIKATPLALEMKVAGKCDTLVNGEVCESAKLQPGDTLMFRGEVLFLCVRRPRTFPALPTGMEIRHPFGLPDAAGIVGEGPEAWRLRALLFAAAKGYDHVLIRGETGVGKDLAAFAVYLDSSRSALPYIVQNIAVLSPSLIAAELFGNIANYPNPGMPARIGIIANAHGGTLFLDEIGELSKEAQAQLLRMLQSGDYRPVGEANPRHADVRFIGATNRDDTVFRDDFRGRFGTTVDIAPLRARAEDIPLLVRHMLLRRAAEEREEKRKAGRKVESDLAKRFFAEGPSGELVPRISGRFIDYLVRHKLPLNMRSVNDFLSRSIAESREDRLEVPSTLTSPLPRSAAENTPAQTSSDASNTEDRTKEEVVASLEAANWNITAAGRLLGKHRNTMHRLMRKYGIKEEDEEEGPEE